MRSRSSV